MKRDYHKWFSSNLQRDMELLVFGHAGKAILFFPTRMARFFDYENWGVVESLRPQLESGLLQLFCVDSVDGESFYNTSEHPKVRIARHRQYERYLIEEVIGLIRSFNGGDAIQTAGCSMGAYHAVNIAMKYPDLFNRAVGLSGRYDLTRELGYFRDLFDGYRSDDVYFSMPQQFLPNLQDAYLLSQLREMEIVLAVGREDPFLQVNLEFDGLLCEKGLSRQLHIWNGNAHRAADWRMMVPMYF